MSIKIELDDDKYEYYPGEVISGSVRVELKEPKYIRKIEIEFKGRAVNDWEGVRKHYVGIKDLFYHNIIFIDKPKKYQLQPGCYKFEFEYQLPNNLPVNWEGPYGSLRYTVKAFIDTPLAIDISSKQQINIIPVVDLNIVSYARKPFYINTHKALGIPCCRSGTVSLTVSAPRRGYICSETIPFSVRIKNDSSSEVYQTKIEIFKKIVYLSTNPKHGRRTELIPFVSGKWATKVSPHGVPQKFDIPLELKLTEPSTVDDSLIIQIIYEVKVTGKITGYNHNIRGRSPIIIGNMPLDTVDINS